jgi:hypothetical protein
MSDINSLKEIKVEHAKTVGKLAQFTVGSRIGDATNTDIEVASAVTLKHSAVTVVDTPTIDFTLVDQQIRAQTTGLTDTISF